MFPSSSSSSRHNSPFPQTNENPNSKHKRPSPPPPSLFLHFPSSPFLDNDHPLVDHLLSQHFIVTTATSTIAAQAESDNINMAAASILNNDTTSNATAPVALKMKKRSSNTDAAKKPTPRKRTGKKDRHSKIYTAQGLRDRRMRLSLQIARKFFDLQDMLGFDKASKTIEWLFTKSKAAIKELTGNLPQIRHSGGCVGGKNNIYMSSSSGCKVIRSEMKENGNNREKKSRKSRNAAFDTIAKESREKARARARERTREKMMMRSLEKLKQCSDQTNPNNLEQVGSSSPFETGDQESGCRSQEMNSSLKNVAEVEEPISTLSLEHQMGSVGIIEKFLGMTSTARSVSIGNYSNNVAVSSGIISNSDFPGFPGDWDMEKARTIHSNYYAATNMDPSTDHALSNADAKFPNHDW